VIYKIRQFFNNKYNELRDKHEKEMSSLDLEKKISEQLTADSTAVQSYLNILQGVVTRMAASSANCKTWCVTLVSAIIVVIADKAKPNYVWIALLPVILFFFLDAYYLGQERSFRAIYNDFIKRLKNGDATASDLFSLIPMKGFNVVKITFEAISSFAIYPFYLTLIVLLIIGRYLIF
jgi:hypothetical protein